VIILAYNPASLPVYTYNQFSGRGCPPPWRPPRWRSGGRRRGDDQPGQIPQDRWCARQRLGGPCAVAVADPARTLRRRPPSRIVSSGAVARFGCEPPGRAGSLGLGQVRPAAVPGRALWSRARASLVRRPAGPGRCGRAAPRGYVAQGFSLYPHLTVWRHLLFARGATPELAAYWLNHLRLDGLESRYPSELSGGQRQRVGLAQVSARAPRSCSWTSRSPPSTCPCAWNFAASFAASSTRPDSRPYSSRTTPKRPPSSPKR